MESRTPYQNNHHLLTVATGSQQLDRVKAISHIKQWVIDNLIPILKQFKLTKRFSTVI